MGLHSIPFRVHAECTGIAYAIKKIGDSSLLAMMPSWLFFTSGEDDESLINKFLWLKGLNTRQ
jgi:hypothetical protein